MDDGLSEWLSDRFANWTGETAILLHDALGGLGILAAKQPVGALVVGFFLLHGVLSSFGHLADRLEGRPPVLAAHPRRRATARRSAPPALRLPHR